MTKTTGYILNVSDEERKQELCESIEDIGFFAEAVPEFEHSRNLPLVCFISFTEGFITHIGFGRRGLRSATGRRRLNIESIKELTAPIAFMSVLSKVAPKVQSIAEDRVQNGGKLPPKTFEEFVDAVCFVSEEARQLIARFGKIRQLRIKGLSSDARKALAAQKEAVVSALGIAGIKRDDMQEWEPPVAGAPLSFLEGLPMVDLREDQMIINDLTQIPGFKNINQNIAGIVQFDDDDSKLKVIIANRLRLEQQTGVDLIYYNETYQSFVMVQYKAMEDRDGEAGFRLPNGLLNEEVGRMEKIISKVATNSLPKHKNAFRFSCNPFFLKFCPRRVFNPDDKALTPGMYLSLDHWKLIEKSRDICGPRGGKRLTYSNVGRYLNNTSFIEIVRNAWVGTTPDQSRVLEKLLEELIKGERAVVLAIKNENSYPSGFDEDNCCD